VAFDLHTWTALTYLAATAVAAVAMAGQMHRGVDAGVGLLGFGAALHVVAIWRLHSMDPVPRLTDLPFAVSLMGLLAVTFYLGLLFFVRGRGLVVAVAPLAFLGEIFASFGLDSVSDAADAAHPVWSHLHVLLASAGLAVLGLAGASGLLYLVRDRQLKAKRRTVPHSELPSLEALDRMNAIALALGFLLLTAGLGTGILWINARTGGFWPGGWHASATLVAWVTYASIVAVRFGHPRSARSAAAGAAAAFAILVVAVIGAQVFA